MSHRVERRPLDHEWRSRRPAAGPLAGIRFAPWILLSLAAGCGEEPRSPQFPVSGKVTIDGKPLEQGSISFLPSASGPAASAPIEQGTFALDRTTGPGQGAYKVEIVSVRSTGKQVVSPDDPSVMIEETRNIIPTRYNTRSDLLVQVSAEGENAYRFDISSKEPRHPRPRPGRRR